MKLRLYLPKSADRYQEGIRRLPELELVHAPADASIEVRGDRRPLWILESTSALPPRLSSAIPSGWIGLIIGRAIPQNLREQLELEGIGWWDLRGGIHVEIGQTLIHIDRTAVRGSAAPKSQDRKLGPAGTRAVQLMLAHPSSELWGVSELSAQADLSIGQAHNVLSLLEQRGFVKAIGRGSSRRRLLEDRPGMLEWLRAGESRLRIPTPAPTFLYARNDVDLATKFAERASAAQVRYAVTSTLGARLRGTPVTTSVVTRIRVDAKDPRSVMDQLGLEKLGGDGAEGGANLELWADTGRVGVHGSSRINGVMVAPEVRIWLDLVRQGGRYEDASDLLKEKILDRA
ncbi:hypothetical protein CLV49_1759 [Labedella gwakjiensis]|uniref:Uncharacterized protein n=1 Tax=Labedella gwakjiensis TaxID=390269 RepID=A0A2P8GW23_9MICO|nr:hypothetical protein CLV49_1759 [Labedella gwakjiensis]